MRTRQRLLDALAKGLLARRVTVVTLVTIAAVVAGVWGARTLKLDADTESLIGESHPFMHDYRAFKRAFGDLEYLIVAVDAKPPGATAPRHAEAKSAVMTLLHELQQIPGLVAVHGVITADEQLRLAPWSPGMSDADLAGLLKASDAFLPILQQRPGAQLLAEAEAQLDRLLPSRSANTATTAPLDRAAQERTGAAAIFTLRAIAAGAPGGDASFGLAHALAPRFLSMPDPPHELGRFLFVTILPDKDYGSLSVIERPLGEIRAVITRTQAAFPDVEIGLTGKPVLQADEMTTTNDDMTRATIIGLILVALLFMIAFRGVRRPLLAVFAFGAGAALTYGAAAILVGRLNLLSLVFMLVLVGVGLDYGIHMVARYVEGLRRMSRRSAIRHMMRTAVPSNATGAAVAGGTFLLALLTPFQGLRELGLIAGTGLIICMAVMAVLLPVLLDLFDGRRRGAPTFIMGHDPRSSGMALDDDATPRLVSPRHVAIAVIGVSVAVLFTIVGPQIVRFESNLLKLQADSVDAVKWEKRIIEENASETWFGAVIVDRIEAVPAVIARAAQEPAIGAVRSVLDLVAMPTTERAALMAELGRATTSESPSIRAATQDSISALDPAAVRRVATKVDQLAMLAALVAPEEARSMRSLADRLRALSDGLDPAHHDAAMIDARRLAVQDALRTTARSLAQMGIGARGTLREALPSAVRAEFASPDGLFCVRLHPKNDVWEFVPMQTFIEAMRRVDPLVTGVPITHFESMLLLERSFLIQGVAAAIFVAIVLFIDLRCARETLACLLALGAGLAWTLGAMAVLGVSFNLANFFGIPIALGLGSDACIHIAHRAREGIAHGFGSTRRAVTVTALTTVIGFGGLLFAQHRGLQSLGVLMVISTLAMLFSTTLLLPSLLRILARLRSSS